MRTYQQILDELKSKLTSDAWNRIQNSIVGRELLAYGAQVLSADENVADYLQKSFNYEQADFPSLLVAAAANDIAINKVKPATITIKLQGSRSTVYKPFQLQAVAGSIMFTNIDFCHGNDEVTLYQGSVIRSTNAEDLAFLNYRYEVTNPLDTVYLPSSDTTVYTYLRLGNAHLESVRVQAIYSGAAIEVPPFDPISYGSDVLSYKLKNLPDGTVCVQSGNGVWGASFIDNNSQISIVYLQPSAQEFTNIDSVVNTDNNTNVTYTLISTSSGSNDDIDYARQMYRKQQLKMCGVISKVQVESFVRAFESILDCKAVVTDNRVTVYVKPADPTNRGTFGEIEMNLAQYGSLLSDYSVLLGRPIEVTFAIYNVPQTMRAAVLSKVQYELDYQKVRFNEAIDIQKISTLIYQHFGIQPLVRMYTKQKASEVLAAVPIQGTVKFYIAGALKAWDENGAIVGVFGGTYTESPQTIKTPAGNGNVLSSKYKLPVTTAFQYFNIANSQNSGVKLMNLDSKLYRNIEDSISDYLGFIPEDVFVLTTPGIYNYLVVYRSTSRYPYLLVVNKDCFWNYPDNKYPFDVIASGIAEFLPERHNEFSEWLGSLDIRVYSYSVSRPIVSHNQYDCKVRVNTQSEHPISLIKAPYTPSAYQMLIRDMCVCPFVYVDGMLYFVKGNGDQFNIELYVSENDTWAWNHSVPISDNEVKGGFDLRAVCVFERAGVIHAITNNFKHIAYVQGVRTISVLPSADIIASNLDVTLSTLISDYELQEFKLSDNAEVCALQVSKMTGVSVYQKADGSLNRNVQGMVSSSNLSQYKAKRIIATFDLDTLVMSDLIMPQWSGLNEYEIISYEGKTIGLEPGSTVYYSQALSSGDSSLGEQFVRGITKVLGADRATVTANDITSLEVNARIFTPFPRVLNYNESGSRVGTIVGVKSKFLSVTDEKVIIQQVLIKVADDTMGYAVSSSISLGRGDEPLPLLRTPAITTEEFLANEVRYCNDPIKQSKDRMIECVGSYQGFAVGGRDTTLYSVSLDLNKLAKYELECHTYECDFDGTCTEISNEYSTVNRVGTMAYTQEKVKFNNDVTSSTDISTIDMEYESVAKFNSEDSYDVLADNPIVWK